jgi:hypothetical protein
MSEIQHIENTEADDGFEIYRGSGLPTNYVYPAISIRVNKSVSFNEAAFEALGRPSHVLLLFNRKTRTIAFQAAKPEEIGAYALKKAPKSVSYSANVRGFLTEYAITADPPRRFSATKKGNRLLVELGDAGDGREHVPAE